MPFITRRLIVIFCLTLNVTISAAQDSSQNIYFYYLEAGQVYRYHPNRQSTEAVMTGAETDIDHATISTDGHYLAYVESAGTLRWIDLKTQTVTTFPPRPTPTVDWPEGEIYHSYVAPVSWSSDGKLFLNQAMWETPYPGWTSVDEPVWHEFPPRPQVMNPIMDGETYYGCGWTAWSPNGSQLLFVSGGPGTACVFLSGVTLIDLKAETARRIVAEQILNPADGTSQEAGVNNPAWSPDNQWIAFNMQVNILSREAKNQFPYGLYIARPDGTDRHLVTQDTESQVMGCNQWTANGSLAYVLLDITDPLIDAALVTGDLYIYQPSSGTQTLALKGIPCPFNLSPNGRFLAFVKNRLLTILPFENQQPITLSEQEMSENNMVGWTQE